MNNSIKKNLLFLCRGNSCRSQMAEGWARNLKGDLFNVYSAGMAPHGLDPRAVKAMAEAGVDISTHLSKHVDDLKNIPFDRVITVCSHADEHCPVFQGPAEKLHHWFEDPPKLAKDAKSEEEALAHYRRIRDEIREFVSKLSL